MADSFFVDTSDITRLTADLRKAAVEAPFKVRQAIDHSAFEVKKKWAEKLEGTPDLPHGSRTITYDIDGTAGDNSTVITAEIGAERGRLQAPIVTVIEFGAPGNHLAPHGYGLAALEEATPDFQRGLDIALGNPLGGI